MISDQIRAIVPIDKVYEDALSPAMKQIGKSLESVAKTSRFLLAPIDYLAAQHDRWERYLQRVSQKVKEEDLVEGHPQIVIPTIEGLSLSYENSLLSELFINLLANSIDKTKQNLAHPAFPNLIKQLSHDEAVMLFYLKKTTYLMVQESDLNEDGSRFFNMRTTREDFPLDKLQFPDQISMYDNHLHSLSLAGNWGTGNDKYPQDPETKKQTGIIKEYKRQLTQFGQSFATACVPDTFIELS